MSKDGQIDRGVHKGIINKDKVNFDKIGIRGLNRISIDKLSNTTTIEVSAKILKQNYIEGINKNTLNEVIDNINSHNIVKFNSNNLIDKATILRMDVTDNVKIKLLDRSVLYKTLSTIPLPKIIQTTLNNTKQNLGVTWKGTQTSLKDRMIAYDKAIQLKFKDKSLHKTDYCNKVMNDFKDVVRFEQNIVTLEAIRGYYKTNNLKDVLISDVKANYLKFDKMTRNNKELVLFDDEFYGMNFKQIRNRLGDERIIDMHNFDWNRILNFIKIHNKNNWHRYQKELKDVFKILQQKKGNEQSLINTIKKELLYA
jgi:hypothetical protein